MTKIIYTLGPSSLHLSEQLMVAGANGVRLTFSYGTPEDQLERAQEIRSTAQKLGISFTIIADLAGSVWRLGELFVDESGQSISLNRGETVYLTHANRVAINSDERRKMLPIADGSLFDRLGADMRLIIGDESAAINIVDRNEEYIIGISETNCIVEGRRKLTVHELNNILLPLTDKDKCDLKYVSQKEEFDAVAISFVSKKGELEDANRIMSANGKRKELIAKIETLDGVTNIEEIMEVCSRIMVARGDLALTSRWELMPSLVDTIVKKCREASKPCIMATQIAEGLNQLPIMTRAELCDLWRWKMEGCESVLLSRETAHGPRPVDAVTQVSRVLRDVEAI